MPAITSVDTDIMWKTEAEAEGIAKAEAKAVLKFIPWVAFKKLLVLA